MNIVMKEARDVDFYVEWSSMVESWTFAGTREEMLAHISRGVDPWLMPEAPHHPANRMARVDETGTSSQWIENAGMRDRYPEDGSWDDTGHIYMQLGYLPRANIFTLARRQLENSDAEVRDLLAPFDDGCQGDGCEHAYDAHRADSGCADCACPMRVQ